MLKAYISPIILMLSGSLSTALHLWLRHVNCMKNEFSSVCVNVLKICLSSLDHIGEITNKFKLVLEIMIY